MKARLHIVWAVFPWLIIAYLLRDVGSLSDRFAAASLPVLVLAGVLLFSASSLGAALWIGMVFHRTKSGTHLSKAALLRAFARGWIARYLPGSLWSQGLRLAQVDATVPKELIAATLLDEFAMVVVTASFLGATLLAASSTPPPVAIALTLVLLGTGLTTIARTGDVFSFVMRMLGPRLPARWRKRAYDAGTAKLGLRLGPAAVFSAGYLAINAAGSVAFVAIVASLTPVNADSYAPLAGSFSLAFVLGVLVVVVPGGLGVREAAVAAIASPVVAPEVSAAAALTFRLLLICADALLVGLVELHGHFSRVPSSGPTQGPPDAAALPLAQGTDQRSVLD